MIDETLKPEVVHGQPPSQRVPSEKAPPNRASSVSAADAPESSLDALSLIRAPYWVTNRLGVDVTIHPEDFSFGAARSGGLVVAHGGRPLPLRIDDASLLSSTRRGGGSLEPGRKVLLQSHAVSISSRRFSERIPRVNIDLVGRTLTQVPFPLIDKPQHTASVVCSVSVLNQVGSSNVLELDTLLRVRNDTRTKLFISVFAEQERASDLEAATSTRFAPEEPGSAEQRELRTPGPDAEDIAVEPGETHSLPLHLAHLSHVSVRPRRTFNRSEPRSLTELLQSGAKCHVACDVMDEAALLAEEEHARRRKAEASSGSMLPAELINARANRNATEAVASAMHSAWLSELDERDQHDDAMASRQAGGAAQLDELSAMHFILSLETRKAGSSMNTSMHTNEDELLSRDDDWRADTQCTVVISPPVVLQNLLASPMSFSLVDRSEVQNERCKRDAGRTPPTHASSTTRDPLTQKLHGAVPRGGLVHFHQFSVHSTLELTVHLDGFAAEDYALVQPVGVQTSEITETIRKYTNPVVTKLRELRDYVDPDAARGRTDRQLRRLRRGVLNKLLRHGTSRFKLHMHEAAEDEDYGALSPSDVKERPLLVLDVEAKNSKSGGRRMCVFTRFWLLNKTGLDLSYRLTPSLPERILTRMRFTQPWRKVAGPVLQAAQRRSESVDFSELTEASIAFARQPAREKPYKYNSLVDMESTPAMLSFPSYVLGDGRLKVSAGSTWSHALPLTGSRAISIAADPMSAQPVEAKEHEESTRSISTLDLKEGAEDSDALANEPRFVMSRAAFVLSAAIACCVALVYASAFIFAFAFTFIFAAIFTASLQSLRRRFGKPVPAEASTPATSASPRATRLRRRYYKIYATLRDRIHAAIQTVSAKSHRHWARLMRTCGRTFDRRRSRSSRFTITADLAKTISSRQMSTEAAFERVESFAEHAAALAHTSLGKAAETAVAVAEQAGLEATKVLPGTAAVDPRAFIELYELVVTTARLPRELSRTYAVNILPRYVLINQTPWVLHVGQKSVDLWRKLNPAVVGVRDGGEPTVWHWPSAQHRRKMVVRVGGIKKTARGNRLSQFARPSMQDNGRAKGGAGGASQLQSSRELRDLHNEQIMYDASMPFGLAQSESGMDAFVVKSRPMVTASKNDSCPVCNVVVDQKLRNGVIFVFFRAAVSRDMNLFVRNETDEVISISQRPRFLDGWWADERVDRNEVYVHPPRYKYTRRKQLVRRTFDAVQARDTMPYALDDPFGAMVLEVHSGPPVTDIASAAVVRKGWRAACPLKDHFACRSVRGAAGEPPPNVVLSLMAMAGKIKVLRVCYEHHLLDTPDEPRGPHPGGGGAPLSRFALHSRSQDGQPQSEIVKRGLAYSSAAQSRVGKRSLLQKGFRRRPRGSKRAIGSSVAERRRDIGQLLSDTSAWHRHTAGHTSCPTPLAHRPSTVKSARGSSDSPLMLLVAEADLVDALDGEGPAALNLYWQARAALDNEMDEWDAPTEQRDQPTLHLEVSLASLGLSVVAKLRDLLRVSISDVLLNFDSLLGEKGPGHHVKLHLGLLRIDNQSLRATLPVVLAQQEGRLYDYGVEMRKIGKSVGYGTDVSVLTLEMEQFTGWKDMLHIRRFHLRLAPLTLQLEDMLFVQLLDLADAIGVLELSDEFRESPIAELSKTTVRSPRLTVPPGVSQCRPRVSQCRLASHSAT